jgi:hypothetical protein
VTFCLRHTAVTSKNRNRHLDLGRNSDCPPFILSSSIHRIDVTLDYSIYSPGLVTPYICSCLTVDTLHIYPHHSYQRRDRSIYFLIPQNSPTSTFILKSTVLSARIPVTDQSIVVVPKLCRSETKDVVQNHRVRRGRCRKDGVDCTGEFSWKRVMAKAQRGRDWVWEILPISSICVYRAYGRGNRN